MKCKHLALENIAAISAKFRWLTSLVHFRILSENFQLEKKPDNDTFSVLFNANLIWSNGATCSTSGNIDKFFIRATSEMKNTAKKVHLIVLFFLPNLFATRMILIWFQMILGSAWSSAMNFPWQRLFNISLWWKLLFIAELMFVEHVWKTNKSY